MTVQSNCGISFIMSNNSEMDDNVGQLMVDVLHIHISVISIPLCDLHKYVVCCHKVFTIIYNSNTKSLSQPICHVLCDIKVCNCCVCSIRVYVLCM